jgi:integrase
MLARTYGDEVFASLIELLLGPRPCEIVSCLVGDVDEDEEPGDLLWVGSKTSAGRRMMEVPGVLRPFLLACCEGKRPDRYLFEAEDGKPHWRDWVRDNVKRICRLADVPEVTAYYLRGQLATITSERGLAGHLLAAHLGHEDEKVAEKAYAAPGAKAKGVARRGLAVLDGGIKSQSQSSS